MIIESGNTPGKNLKFIYKGGKFVSLMNLKKLSISVVGPMKKIKRFLSLPDNIF